MWRRFYKFPLIPKQPQPSNIVSKRFSRSAKLFGCGLGIGLGVALYVYFTPPEQALMKSAINNFDKSYTYDGKLKILSYIPEPRIPILTSNKEISKLTVDKWENLVSTAFDEVEKSWLLKTINYMRQHLLNEIRSFADIEFKIKELQKVLPPSFEQYIAIEEQIQNEIKKNGFVQASVLNKTINNSQIINSVEAKMLEMVIGSYPGRIDELVQYLSSDTDPTSIPSPTMIKIRTCFRKLHPQIQHKILSTISTKTIEHVLESNSEAYNQFVDKYIIQKMKSNDIAAKCLDEIRTVFVNLPPRLQSQMFLSSVQNLDKGDNIGFIKQILGHSVVLIKLGQIISEDPKVPSHQRKILAELRESNTEQYLIEFWSKMPEAMRAEISSVGKCLGIGSIKQVHRIKMKDGSDKVLCCIRNGVEDDALSTLKALEKVGQIQGLASRLRKIIINELSMWYEADAFYTLQKSNFGKSAFIGVPDIHYVTNQFLIRDEAIGMTLANLPKNSIIPILKQVHQISLKSAFVDGIVVGDLHLGNETYDEYNKKVVFFDLGQNAVLTQDQSNTLLWLLVAISDNQRLPKFKSYIMAKLNNICKGLTYDQNLKLGKIYDSCLDINTIKYRFTYFLVEAERNNIVLPIGFFSCAKMLDSIISQERVLCLDSNMATEIASIFRSQLSYSELVSLGFMKMF